MPLKELQIPKTRQMLSTNHKCIASAGKHVSFPPLHPHVACVESIP